MPYLFAVTLVVMTWLTLPYPLPFFMASSRIAR
jgi:hypothetical protein